ncbi:galactose oxidase-like domain-containing protein [Streptomyces sp. NPDC041068]|uniref:galactose oxidase-like domain-containing protein n=1 Tax=Streptomyces sp. NPDC041068 TaxID=3155130 RepID=UPI0033EE0515
MAGGFAGVPDWPQDGNAGVGVAVADLGGTGRLDAVVLAVADRPERNAGYYRVGRGLAADGAVRGGWGPWRKVPDWFSWLTSDGGLAVADVDGDGRPDLVVFMVDAPQGPNAGYYRIGHALDADGAVTGGWGPWLEIPDWFSWRNQGADIAVADVDGDGRPDLVVFMVDAPEGPNAGYYRIGHALDADGTVTGGWGPWAAVPDWGFWENQGAGVTLSDLDGDGRLELIVLAVDNPQGQNSASCTVGWALDATGRAAEGWGPWAAVGGWRFWENGGAAAATTHRPGAAPGELLILVADDPPGAPAGYRRVIDLSTDLDDAAELGVWRLMDFGTDVNPVHAALLHTGDVLFFSGSGNDPDRLNPQDFRTRLWRYPTPRLEEPATPIDLFCCGQAFLPDGRLLAAGGTQAYDPFRGLRDAVVFDPATGQWTHAPAMAGGRWYPALLALPDGRVLAVSGLGTDGNLNMLPEAYDDSGSPSWSTLPSAGPLPMYAHLFLLADGRIFYSGGQYGGNNGTRPLLWNSATGATATVTGLPFPDMRNQSTSVLLPPAQDQRVLIAGGGGYDMHSQAPAVSATSIADLTATAPTYRAVEPMHHPRMHLCAALLPDRTVLISGGAEMEEDADTAVHDAEIFDPMTEKWVRAARARVPRLYHSVALLAADGRVLTAGSNPQRKAEDWRIEVYSPPYLFRGPRPRLALSTESGTYGGSVSAQTDVPPRITKISLIRPGATTHSCDNEQRLVDVSFAVEPTGLRLQLPSDRNLAPPGWYLVFATDGDNVPSYGQWLRLA